MASGSGLCKTTSNFIWGQLLLLGEGIPDPGDIFNTGSSLFKQISDKMGLGAARAQRRRLAFHRRSCVEVLQPRLG
ncbi:hypothetical protein B8A25_12750 [Mycobacterium tuberculosis variant microti]|nr:hypothetical protein B8A25_12750 [Mycobacterium tuberculosis variant microti]